MTKGITVGFEEKDRNKTSEALANLAMFIELSDSVATREERRVRFRVEGKARLHIVEEKAYQGAFYTQLHRGLSFHFFINIMHHRAI